MTQRATPFEEAIEWHIRLAEEAADWDGFTLWLEADPAHRAAYDVVAQADDRLESHAAELRAHLPANDDGRDDPVLSPSATRRWQPMAVAALFVAVMTGGATYWQMRSPAETLYTTNGTASKMIALDNGASIRLDRNSEIRVAEADVARVTMVRGAAFFDAPADPDPSFDVRIGDYRVSDVGTKFAVSRAGGEVQVQVAQGTVMVGAGPGPALSLQQGRGMQIAEKGGQTRTYRMDPKTVASWRTGQLAYDDAPIAVVIADLQRQSGLTITLDPRIADQHFSGVLPIGDGTKLVSDFSSLTGFVAEQRGKKVYLHLPR